MEMASAPMQDAPILRYYAGSDEAFDELCSAWRRRLVGFLTALGASWHDAEDLAHQTLYLVARTRVRTGRYDPGMGTFDAWILKIARNVWTDHLRQIGRHPERETAQDADIGDGALLATHAEPARQETATMLHELLMQLPPEQREALILHDFEGLSYREAGETLGVPQGTVASRRELGLTKLRAHWSAGHVREGVAT